MSEAAKEARRKMQEKAKRLTTASNEKVDASDFDGYPDLEANVATGVRPLSRRQFRKGGKVVAKVEGVDAKHHMGRKPRKGGGSALTSDSLINRDVREANEKRDGIKHDGGFKRGGRTKRDSGGPINDDMGVKNFGVSGSGWDDKPSRNAPPIPKGGYNDPYEKTPPKLTAQQQADMGRKAGGRAKHSDEAEDRALVKKMVRKESLTGKREGGALDGVLQGTRPTGGRLARKDGGGNWITGAIKHPGALHKELGVPAGSTIPTKKLEKAEHSKNPLEAKRARLAETLKRMPRASGGDADGDSDNSFKRSGRTARASGGSTKGKTNINIIIDAQPKPQGMRPPIGAVPIGPNGLAGPGAGGAMPIPVSAPAPMGGGAPPMPPQMPPQGAPMPRKSGGRTGYELEDGAGGGEGRLQKLRWYGRK